MSRYLLYITDNGAHDFRAEVEDEFQLWNAIEKLSLEEIAHRRKFGPQVVKPNFQLSVFEIDTGRFIEVLDLDASKEGKSNE